MLVIYQIFYFRRKFDILGSVVWAIELETRKKTDFLQKKFEGQNSVEKR